MANEGKRDTDRGRASRTALAAATRAGAWIVGQQRPDGSFRADADGVGAYYKIPYMLATLGRLGEAARLLDWVADHHFTPDGDFRAQERKARAAFHDSWPTYSNAWLVQGAHKAGRFDLSFPGAEFILGHQTPAGGFGVLADGRPELECVCTSWGGLAVLTVGHLEAAKRAGQCLVRLVDQQPHPDRFYFRMKPDGELMVDAPPGQELGYFVDSGKLEQIYFHPGIALAFLCRLHLATGDEEFAAAGRRIFDFTRRCAPDVYRTPPSGKLGLGAVLLAGITGEREPAAAAREVADYLVGTQQPDGFWLLPDLPIYASIKDKNDPEITLDITAEFGTFLHEIASLAPDR